MLAMDLQNHSNFLLQQKITVLVNRYEYFLYDNNQKGEHIGFAEQKRFAFREGFTIWTDDSRSQVLCAMKAEKVFDVHGKFLITDGKGNLLGYARKDFAASLLRSTWSVHAADDSTIFAAQELSPVVAILRRVGSLIPVLGDFLELLSFKFQFIRDGKVVGRHERVWTSLKDTYHIFLNQDAPPVDRRVLLAFGILLDALQAR